MMTSEQTHDDLNFHKLSREDLVELERGEEVFERLQTGRTSAKYVRRIVVRTLGGQIVEAYDPDDQQKASKMLRCGRLYFREEELPYAPGEVPLRLTAVPPEPQPEPPAAPPKTEPAPAAPDPAPAPKRASQPPQSDDDAAFVEMARERLTRINAEIERTSGEVSELDEQLYELAQRREEAQGRIDDLGHMAEQYQRTIEQHERLFR